MSEKVSNKRVFEVEVDGKKVEFAVVRPNNKVMAQGTLVYNRAFREAVQPADGKKGAIVRQGLDALLREQNLWDDAKQARYEELVKTLLDGEKKLAQGGIKLSEAKAVALAMRRARLEVRWLLQARNEYDEVTAEAQAEQARFNYFVAACTVYGESGERYFKDAEDYLSRENDPVVLPAATNMGKLLYNLDDEHQYKLPENKFLTKYKLVDDKLRLVDKDGKLVDELGRPVDDQGRLINSKGELIDADGNLLTEDGEYKVEFKEFEDDVFGPSPATPAGEQESPTATTAA